LAEVPYGVFALVLTPTRELALQIADQFNNPFFPPHPLPFPLHPSTRSALISAEASRGPLWRVRPGAHPHQGARPADCRPVPGSGLVAVSALRHCYRRG
ncbi:unnamed protein product, partial [Closterium sp. NIES-54]